MIKNCKFCSKNFIGHPSDEKFKRGKFCSRKCAKFWFSKNSSRENSPKWKGGRVIKSCQICENKFEIAPSVLKINRGKFCSRKCMGISQSKTKIKQNHWNWKGGITTIYHKIRTYKKHIELLKQSKQRDNFQCLMPSCDSNSRVLHSNHIKTFSSIIKENNIKTIKNAENCKELWDIKNLITLCKPCHKHIRGREKEFENLFKGILNRTYQY